MSSELIKDGKISAISCGGNKKELGDKIEKPEDIEFDKATALTVIYDNKIINVPWKNKEGEEALSLLDIENFIKEENINNGIIYNCVKHKVPFVLAGSIRDDGPLPEVYGNVYEAQDAMRSHVRKATTVICLATMLHTIATGNMTPSFRVMEDGSIREVYFYCVDISEFTVNKLTDRGSLSARGIVTNVQDFVTNVCKGLGLELSQ